MNKIVLGVVLPLLVIVAAVVFAIHPTRAQQVPNIVAGPARWVPFQAKLHRFHPTGDPRVEATGIFARASDGSTYTSVDASFGHYTLIHNFSKRESYELPPGNSVWIIHPMEIPAGLMWRSAPPSGVGHDNASAYVHEGFITVVTQHGRSRVFHAPALNFYEVRKEFEDGSVEEITNIQQGEPPADWFQVPLGALTQRSGGALYRIMPVPGKPLPKGQ